MLMNKSEILRSIEATMLNMHINETELDLNKLKLINLTTHLYLNQTDQQLKILDMYRRNRSVDGSIVYILILVYSLLILFGVFGNAMVVSAVIRKTAMRTVRNMFIINLAVSDLLLCVVTMPLTLIEILSVYWPFGEHVLVCKVVGCLQAVSIFVSTISITAIALDRYHVIVYPTRASVKRVGAVIALAGIWMFACLLSAPLFLVKQLIHEEVNLSMYDLSSVNYCLEEWPVWEGQLYYSCFTIIIQYFLPIIVVVVAYSRICIKLRYRMRPGGRTVQSGAGGSGGIDRVSSTRDSSRVRRTNTLLISIAVIFGISWMPLNLFNIIVYKYEPFKDDNDIEGAREKERIVYSLCHLVAMTSACSNPVLYGWLNENFRKEFKDIWASFKSFCCRAKLNNEGGRSEGAGSVSMRVNVQQPAAHSKTRATQNTEREGEVEQSTLITQVLDRHK